MKSTSPLTETPIGRSDRPVFSVPKPLPERQRDADGNYLPDPPIVMPSGYSMMAMIEDEHRNPRPIRSVREYQTRAQSDTQRRAREAENNPRPPKKKKTKGSKSGIGKY
jgi:hypothetical protein